MNMLPDHTKILLNSSPIGTIVEVERKFVRLVKDNISAEGVKNCRKCALSSTTCPTIPDSNEVICLTRKLYFEEVKSLNNFIDSCGYGIGYYEGAVEAALKECAKLEEVLEVERIGFKTRIEQFLKLVQEIKDFK